MRGHVHTLPRHLVPVEDADQFFDLYDAMLEAESGFLCNRESLLDAWKRGGELYTLQITETNGLYRDWELRSKLADFLTHSNPSRLCIPVFCWRGRDNGCIIVWTAPHLRRLGLATNLLLLLKITHASGDNTLPDAQPFWNHFQRVAFETRREIGAVSL